MKFKRLIRTLLPIFLVVSASCGTPDMSSEITSTIEASPTESSTSSVNCEDYLSYAPRLDGTCAVTMFYCVPGLEEIVVPEYSPDGDLVTSVGRFSCDDYLKRITLPSSITCIEQWAFRDCSNLESITLNSDLPVEISNEAFLNCTSLREINIPGGISNVWNGAFRNCKSLTDITFPAGLELIGSMAFGGCENLEEVHFPNTLKTVMNSFESCKKIRKITIPGSVEKMYYSFQGCSSLSTIILEDGVGEIFGKAFAKTAIKEIYLPDSVIMSSENAFDGCSQDLVIYCEASSEPDTWYPLWNEAGYKVVWSASRSDLTSQE